MRTIEAFGVNLRWKSCGGDVIAGVFRGVERVLDTREAMGCQVANVGNAMVAIYKNVQMPSAMILSYLDRGVEVPDAGP